LIAGAIARRLPGSRLEPIGGAFLNILGGDVVPFARDDRSHVLEAMIEEDRTLRDSGFSHFAFALWQKPEA
jgi:hypothetical protein